MHQTKMESLLLEHIARHTIAIDRYLPTDNRERALLGLERLHRMGQISQWTHQSGLRYWTRSASKPLSDSSLVRSLGFLLFCQQPTRRRLTSSDIDEFFPSLFRHGLPGGHYIDCETDSPCLGRACVDTGASKVKRITVRAGEMIRKYRQSEAFNVLLKDNRFQITWIVPTTAKQHRLTEALAPLVLTGVNCRVCAIPELLNVLAPIPQRV